MKKKKQKRNKKSKTISPHPATRTPVCAKPELRCGEGRGRSFTEDTFIETNYYSPSFDASEEMNGYQLAEPINSVKREAELVKRKRK